MKDKFILKLIFSIFLINISMFKCYSQKEIIKKGDEWLYYDEIQSPNSNWYLDDTVTTDWKIGTTPLGYGDSVIETEISFGNDPKNKTITHYFKKTFYLDNPYDYIIYKLDVQKDDGIVIYLNGKEVTRIDMPDGPINHNSLARGLIVKGVMEDYTHTVLLSPEDFVVGKNNICASVHKANSTSIDCIFNLKLLGDNDPSNIPQILKNSSLKNIQLNNKVNSLVSKLEIDKKNLQIELIKQSKSSIQIYLYILASILLIVLFFFIFIINKARIHKKQQFLQINMLKNNNLEKDRQLMNATIKQYNTQQCLIDIKKELEKQGQSELKSFKNTIEKLIFKINFNIDQTDSWENLKYHFNAIHSGFIEKLSNKHPSLTETEVRHCVFMKLHLQTKEIANILHIDPRSVQASRYRIKKKMMLDENIDLKEYLKEI